MLRRITHHMKNQSWGAVGIEFVLVVAGVFLGIVAANWNEERLERRETAELLQQVDAEMADWDRYIEGVKAYYGSTAGYARQAAAAWSGDRSISDNDFVIAVYQASQISGIANSSAVWSQLFGADQLRDIEDRAIREELAQIMSFDYALVDLRAVSTRYREEVRKLIPNELQARIRATCGDRQVGGPQSPYTLPTDCDLRLDPLAVKRTATSLRARADLAAELNWHQAAVANQLAQASVLHEWVRSLARRIQ